MKNFKTLEAYLGWRMSTFKKYNKRFKETFKKSLQRYWNNATGFNIIKFDEDFPPASGESLNDCIVRRFGEPAAKIIQELIK